MQITSTTTIKSVLDAHPKAVAFFAAHDLGLDFMSDESMLWTEMEMCKRLGPSADLDGLLLDLQAFIDAKAK